MSVRRREVLFFLPALLWMLLIFFFSAMPEEVSEEQSDYVSIRLQQIIIATLSGNGREAMEEWEAWAEEGAHFSVRKEAHVVEYSILCLLLFLGFAGRRYARRLSFLVTVAYAVSDEIHQMFVPGRAGMMTDVLIDCCGALLGFVLLLAGGRGLVRFKRFCLSRGQTGDPNADERTDSEGIRRFSRNDGQEEGGES